MGVYGLSTLLNSAIPFFLIPILTRYLSPNDYGVVSMFGTILSFLGVFIGFGVISAVARKYIEKDQFDFQSYLGNCLALFLASAFVAAILISVFIDQIEELTTVPAVWIWAAFGCSLCQFLIQMVLLLWQMGMRAIQYAIFQVSQTLIVALLSILFVVSLGWEWRGRLYAQVFTAGFFALFSLGILFHQKWVSFRINRIFLKHALAFGLPIIPHSLGWVLIEITDRLLLTNLVGVADTGVYSVGLRIGMILSLVCEAANKAWMPWIFEQLKNATSERRFYIVKLTYALMAGLVVVAIGSALVAPWFMHFFVGKEFQGATQYILWLSLASCFNGFYLLVANYIFYEQKTYWLSIGSFLIAIVNAVASYTFIVMNGTIGAAQGTCLSFFIGFIFTWLLAARVHPMPWNPLKWRGA